MSLTLKFRLTRMCVAVWPLVPCAVKVAMYKHHRKVIVAKRDNGTLFKLV